MGRVERSGNGKVVRQQELSGTLADVFEFFADPYNLETITPPWLHFHVVRSSTPRVEEGTTIDYRLRLRGVPVRWRSVIRSWNPPHEFIDEQLRGPYRSWVHHHSFRETENGVLVADTVDYRVPGGRLIDWLFVRRDLARIFDYRGGRLEDLHG